MRGRLLLLVAVFCFVAMPVLLVVGLVAPMGAPLPDDPEPNVNPAYPEVYFFLAGALLAPIAGALVLRARERWLRRDGFFTATQVKKVHKDGWPPTEAVRR